MTHNYSFHDTRTGQPHHNAPGSPHAMNVPGQGSESYGYSSPLPYHDYAPQTHRWNGVGHGDPYLQAPVSSRLQPGIGHGMPSPQSSMTRSPPLQFRQLYTVQPASVTHPIHSPGFVHQQSPESMIASGSQSQSPAGVQNATRGRYYQQWSPSYTAISSPVGSFSQLPVSLRPFDMTGTSERLPPPMPIPQQFSRRRGKRRALIIGINYSWHQNPAFKLKCCVDDAYCMANFLRDKLGFAREDVCIMTDNETPWSLPTKDNILRNMTALVHNAQPHDSFFLYYSGHAVQVEDLDGDELDGFDESICAMDFSGNDLNPNPNTPGLIVDDEMHRILVKRLPVPCRLTAIFDSCHSGTLLDLPFQYDTNGVVKEFRHPKRLDVLREKLSYAHAVSLSASKDSQNALETSRGGALRRAFMHCMKKFGTNITYKDLIWHIREYMTKHRFPQRPQLSSSHEIDTSLPFII